MFRLNRNERSHWSGNGVHVESELVFMIGRNMHRVDADKRRGLRVGFVGLQARSSVPPACTGDKGRSACLWQLHQVATTLLRRRNMRFPDELKVNILRQICGIAGIARPVP